MYDTLEYGGSAHDHLRRIVKEKFDFLGISVFAEEFRSWTYWLVRQIRRAGFKGHVCVGGLDPSLNWKRYLTECSGIDSVVIGEGEQTLLEIVGSLSNRVDWQRIKGIAFRNGNEIVKNTERGFIGDLDSLPFMARDFLERYVKKFGNKVWASMLAGRGCYQRCSYCSVAPYQVKLGQTSVRYRSTENIVAEMLQLHDRFGVTRFYFHGTAFLSPFKGGMKRLQKFCDEAAKLPFKVQFRIQTTVDVITEELLFMLKKAGLVELSLCFDAFIDRYLELYNLNFGSQDALNALQMAHSLGFSVKVNSPLRIKAGFMPFNPYTTVEDLRKQLPILKKYEVSPKKLGEKVKIYDQSELERKLQDEKLLISNHEYIFVHRNVSVLYETYQRYYKHVASFRTRIRNLEKTVDQFGIEVDLTDLRKIREQMENICYDFFESVLSLSEEIDYDKLMTDYYRREIHRFDQKFRIKELETRINSLEKQLNISDEMRDMHM
jgi:hypothetical protein